MNEQASPAVPWTPGELRVVIVDDDADVLLGLRILVDSLEAEVRTAASGEEALALIRQDPPHLVLSDIAMEGMSGTELLDRVRRDHPDVKVVLITGYGTIELAVSAMHRGAAHFITKPFDNEEILEAVRRYGQEALVDRKVRSLADSTPPEDEPTIIAEDPRMRTVLELIDQVAPTSMTVLIQGESGTGKELVARAIHNASPHRSRPFLAVNTAALPDTLLESELFGHRRGAFTGADRDREGLFQQAAGGTVFLDEIAFMSRAFQGKLLRVLQERAVTPLGTTGAVPVDFRLIAATSRNLRARIEEGEFREDLFYRLHVVTVDLPPLRERPGDLVPLAAHFLAKYADQVQKPGQPPPHFSASALEELMRASWPGNVRELENCIQRALVLSQGGEIHAYHLGLGEEAETWAGVGGGDLSYEEAKSRAIERFQRQYIERALSRTGGNVSRAAQACGLTRAAFQRIMRALKIDRRAFVKD